MPSPAQYAANRLNALKSSGPTSPQGRARSSMNALRHGLTARVVVLPSEDMAAYKAFSVEIVDSLDAQTPVERQFAQTVADNQWRINRIRSIEDGMLGMARRDRLQDSLLAEKAAFNLTRHTDLTSIPGAPAISSPVGFPEPLGFPEREAA